MSDLFPPIITTAGVQPTPPAVLRAALIALVSAAVPGYTANLPGSLIEDISSTDVGALIISDQARVELLNSLTVLGANDFLLAQLGQMLGIPLGVQTNTSVLEVFSGPVGYVIPKGFTVSDGTYQYVAKDGGIIGAGGVSSPLFFLASVAGTWAVPPGTVTQLITSVPSSVVLTVTNPAAGLPGAGAETSQSYRTRCLQGNLAASQGMSRYLKTLLNNVSGVQSRLTAVVAQGGGGWMIMAAGGDPYEMAYAIFSALFDISTLVGSTIAVTAITKATHGQVTTAISHGLAAGQTGVKITGVVGMVEINGIALTVNSIVSDTVFTVTTNTSGFTDYVSGGVVTPNSRNVSVSISDYPDTYIIPIVEPLAQVVTMNVTWNTTSLNFVSSAAVAQLGAPALAAYVNAIAAGHPMNLYELQTIFQVAVSSVLDPSLLTSMVFEVNIDGVEVDPPSDTGIIQGDVQSYLTTTPDRITITQS